MHPRSPWCSVFPTFCLVPHFEECSLGVTDCSDERNLQKNQFVNDSATCLLCVWIKMTKPFFLFVFLFTSKYSVFVFCFSFSLSLFVAARLQQFWVWIFWICIFMLLLLLLLLLISEEEKPVVFRLVGVCCFCYKIFWNLAPSISGLGARFCFSWWWVSRVCEEERERQRDEGVNSWNKFCRVESLFFFFLWGGRVLILCI